MISKGHASFFMAEDFFSLVTFFHTVAFRGRPGAGKTYLAVLLAAWLKSRGLVDKVVSNFPVAFAESDVTKLDHTAIILDETWQFINTRKDVFGYAAVIRHIHSYLLMPSVFPPHRLLTRFKVGRSQNLFAYGIPAWMYRWRLDMEDEKEKGVFFVIHPERAFAVYDTEFIPPDDGGILDGLQATTKIHPVKYVDQDQDDTGAIEDALSDVVEEIQESTTAIEDQAEAFRKARNRIR